MVSGVAILALCSHCPQVLQPDVWRHTAEPYEQHDPDHAFTTEAWVLRRMVFSFFPHRLMCAQPAAETDEAQAAQPAQHLDQHPDAVAGAGGPS